MRRKALLLLISLTPSLPLLYVILLLLQENSLCSDSNSGQGYGAASQGLSVVQVPAGQASLSVVPVSERPVQPQLQVKQEPEVPVPESPHAPLHKYLPNSGDTNFFKVDPRDLELSETSDIEKRGKFQQRRISEMCHKHFFPREQRLPQNDDLRMFFRHLMFDDQHKAIFCFVPKIGCTNMKRLMLYMGGQLPLNTVDWPWVEDSIYLEPALSKVSFMNSTLSTNQKIMRLKSYFKFTVVRNPLERFVSAYRNKLEAPVRYDQRDKFPESLKMRILEDYRSTELHQWARAARNNKTALSISVSFAEYVHYYVETASMTLNDHVRPTIDICHPCLIKYNFYGNFRNYSTDVAQLIDKFGTDPRFYRDESLHSSEEQTEKKLVGYYSQLSHRDKLRLLGRMYDDLLFYYTLYPADRDSHFRLLGIKLQIV